MEQELVLLGLDLVSLGLDQEALVLDQGVLVQVGLAVLVLVVTAQVAPVRVAMDLALLGQAWVVLVPDQAALDQVVLAQDQLVMDQVDLGLALVFTLQVVKE